MAAEMDDEMLDKLCDEVVEKLAAAGFHISRAALRERLEILRGLCWHGGQLISLDQINLDSGDVIARITN